MSSAAATLRRGLDVPGIRRPVLFAILGSVLLAGLLVLIAVVALAPFVKLAYGDIPSYLVVNSRPEAHLYYPGSPVLAVETMGQVATVDSGPIPAHSSALLAPDATTSPSAVMAWYRDSLTKRGWTEVGAGSFRRAGEIFMVQFWSQGQVRITYAAGGCQKGGTTCFAMIVGSSLSMPLESGS